jgi:pseudouridine kinase
MTILVVGSAIVDIVVRPIGDVVRDTSNEASIVWAAGGAGRNVAENLKRLGAEVVFVTDFAGDVPGRFLQENLERLGIDVRRAGSGRSGVYLALLDGRGSLDRGFCQTTTEFVGLDDIERVLPDLGAIEAAVLDANLSGAVLAALASRFRRARIAYALETTAIERSHRVREALPGCALIKPDRVEATALTGLPCATPAEAVECARALRAAGGERVIVSLGSDGLVFEGNDEQVELPAMAVDLVDATGAGDAMLAASFLGLLKGLPPRRYLEAGLRAAALTCRWEGAVSPHVSAAVFDQFPAEVGLR